MNNMGTLYRRSSSPKWYGEYTDSQGRRVQRTTGTSNKRDAAAILAKWEADANNQRHGIAISPVTTLESVLQDWIAYLADRTPKHKDAFENKVRRIVDSLGYVFPRDFDRVQIETIVKSFRTPHGKPISLRTQSHYLTAIKSFSKWLTELRGAFDRDPLAAIKKPNFERDRKLIRRFLTTEEWHWLSKTPNALLYETAIATGLRVSELRALQPECLRDDHLHLAARHTKNGKAAKQYISADLRKRLENALPFAILERSAEQFREDLAAARELWLATDKPKKPPEDFLAPVSRAGDKLDFHALRHTCGAWLAIAGVNVKVIQSIMRHSTITLTLDTYGHLLPGAEQDAARQLSVLLTQASARQHPESVRQRKQATEQKAKENKGKREKPK